MKAIIKTGNGEFELRDVVVPKPGPGQVLVKIIAVAQNPSDLMKLNASAGDGAVIGDDFAGIVEELGSDIPEGTQKIGDRVAGFVHGVSTANGASGSFAEYVVADAHVLISIPESWSFEQAAQLGLATFTVCQLLYQSQSLASPANPSDTTLDVLIWGGATVVGQYAIQFAHLGGMRVIATASKKNFELLRSLGASDVFDYSDPTTPQKIKQLTGGKLKHAVDCVSAHNAPGQISECLADQGGVVSVVLPYETKRLNVETKFLLVHTLLGRAIDGPASYNLPKSDEERLQFRQRGAQFAKIISDVVARGLIKPTSVKLLPNGLASVKDGFQYMTDGKVSAEKITYIVADTPK
ncbi:GroES-like protein [Rickenella mellea]|uniref:GroES-like protein n=1 Tax=Rickenella mellea TaxID=50990 RepID=A0A4Y7Q5M3_9AGAM|nr:GroES-like protein [Rickenella mellea]